MPVRFAGDSVTLTADVEGAWSGPAVLLLHGGGQTRQSWGGTSQVLADVGFLALTVDQRGHGESDWAADGNYGISAYARDVRAVASQLGRPVALVGASLGGLASLLAVAEQPGVDATALVLVDVTPRMRQDGRDRIGDFMRGKPEGFASVEEAADAVSQYLPDRPRPKDVSGLRRNLRPGPDGRLHWHWDPKFLDSRLQDETKAISAAVGGVAAHGLRHRINNLVVDRQVSVPAAQAQRGHAPMQTTVHCAMTDLPDTPRLAGQHYDYLMQALKAYRKGSRQNPIMAAMAQLLTEQEIHELALYYSTQQGLAIKY